MQLWVGSCKHLAKRVCNCISSIGRESPGCKIEHHFLRPGHSISDYAVLGIVPGKRQYRGKSGEYGWKTLHQNVKSQKSGWKTLHQNVKSQKANK